MTTTQDSTEILLNKIENKRSEIDSFLTSKEPRYKRLTNIAIICGTIASVLTAGPALGSNSFTTLITDSFGLTSPAWQLLCLAATIFSKQLALIEKGLINKMVCSLAPLQFFLRGASCNKCINKNIIFLIPKSISCHYTYP